MPGPCSSWKSISGTLLVPSCWRLQGSHTSLCIDCSAAWDEKLQLFPACRLFKFFSFLRRGLPCFGVSWLPSPTTQAADSPAVEDDAQGQPAGRWGPRCPLAPPVSALLLLASLFLFLCPVCWRAGPTLSLPSTVSLTEVTQWARAPGSCVPSEPFELEPRLPLAFPSSEKLVLLPGHVNARCLPLGLAEAAPQG